VDPYRSLKLGFAVDLVLVAALGCRDRGPELTAEPVPEKILAQRGTQVALIPEMRNGQVIAVRVFPLAGDAATPPSEGEGFQVGDQIEAIDDIAPNASNDAFLEAFRRLGKAPETRIRVRRHGRSVELIVRGLAGR